MPKRTPEPKHPFNTKKTNARRPELGLPALGFGLVVDRRALSLVVRAVVRAAVKPHLCQRLVVPVVGTEYGPSAGLEANVGIHPRAVAGVRKLARAAHTLLNCSPLFLRTGQILEKS